MMKSIFGRANKILIVSFLFMQLNTAFAQYFHHNKLSFISLCTQHGIVQIALADKVNSEKSSNVAEIMNCCLDIQSNFIFSQTSILLSRNTIYSIGSNDHDFIRQLINYDSAQIRAPPILT